MLNDKAKKKALEDADFTNVFQAKTAWSMGWDAAMAAVMETMSRKHIFWKAGEADCPRDIKAANGELHTLRCKVCGLDRPPSSFCTGHKEHQGDWCGIHDMPIIDGRCVRDGAGKESGE